MANNVHAETMNTNTNTNTNTPTTITTSETASSNSSPIKDNFTPLQNANKLILSALRSDETSNDADLARRCTSLPAANPVRYIYDDGSNDRIQSDSNGSDGEVPSEGQTKIGANFRSARIEHSHSIPLPSFLSEEARRKVKLSSSMGIFQEVGLVWMTVDSTLYLWSYCEGSNGNPSGDFCSFDGAGASGGQCIVSVGLVRPKKGRLSSLHF